MNKTVAFCTLGCKANQYDTDAMRTCMESDGYCTVDFSDTADVYVINTCSVTHVSDRKSRQMIGRAHRRNPNAIIVVAGCYAKTAHDEVEKIDGVDIVLGTNDRNRIAEVVNAKLSGKCCELSETDTSFELLQADTFEKTRAYLKIQDGCNRFCTYCIIPYARGRIRSRPLDNTRYELERIAGLGYSEIVLTGIHLMSYGMDMQSDTSIVDVLALTDDIQSLKRVRLGSLEPEFVTTQFANEIAQRSKICRQFHLSLQSGSDTVLSRMKRRYTADEYARSVEVLRSLMPNCAITTDIIAGFPGETETEHQETLEFIRRIRFSKIHVFPYSRRSGTPAAVMDNQVPAEIKERRVAQIIELANEMHNEYISSYVNTTVSVLFEERCDDYVRGYTDTYVDVRVFDCVDDCAVLGKILNVHVESTCDSCLVGRIIK